MTVGEPAAAADRPSGAPPAVGGARRAGPVGEFADREHFIPLRVPDLVALLCGDRGPGGDRPLSAADQARFRRFADAAAAHVHARFLDQLKRLKDAYAPFDPDADTRPLDPLSDPDRAVRVQDFFAEAVALLERANYVRLSRPELEAVMYGASDWGVDMDVAWDCFDRLEVFVRGKGFGKRVRKRWWGLRPAETVTLPTFQRVLVVLKQRPHPRLGADADTRSVFLKLFKDIPRMDVEMLLPGTRLKMPLLERFKLGGSAASSVGYVLWKLKAVSLGAITGAVFGSAGLVGLLALYGPLSLLVGYGYKTYASFQTTRQTYQLQLTQSLYYQNLDNNAGVLFRMLDEAEEQEVREVLLAYFYLWRYAGDAGWTAAELDDYVELDLERRLEMAVDFEVSDALDKLIRAGVATADGGRYRSVPLEAALDRLDDVWEKYAHAATA